MAGRRSRLPRPPLRSMHGERRPLSRSRARPLFFGTLNTPFSRRARTARAFGRVPFPERRSLRENVGRARAPRPLLSDDAYGALLFDVFGQYRLHRARGNGDLDGGRRSRDAWPSVRVAHGTRGRRRTARSSLLPLVERVSTSALAAPRCAMTARALAGEPLPAARADTPRGGRAAHGARPGMRIGATRARARAGRVAAGDAGRRTRPQHDPSRRPDALDLRRRRQPDRGLAVRAPALVVGRDRERDGRSARRHAASESRPKRSHGRRALRPRVRVARDRSRRQTTARLRERYARATGRRRRPACAGSSAPSAHMLSRRSATSYAPSRPNAATYSSRDEGATCSAIPTSRLGTSEIQQPSCARRPARFARFAA